MFNFPVNPNVNDQYTYGGKSWKCTVGGAAPQWEQIPVSTSDAEIATQQAKLANQFADELRLRYSDVAPLNPKEGQEWYNTVRGKRFAYRISNNKGNWVEVGNTQSISYQTVIDAQAVLNNAAKKDELASVTGASMSGYDLLTVQDVLDTVRPIIDYSALRLYAGRAKQIRITTPGIAGDFSYDATDTTSPDNDGTLIIDQLGRRWKRVFSGRAKVQWFNAKGDKVTNDTVAIQKALDNHLAVEILDGTFITTQPLLLRSNHDVDATTSTIINTSSDVVQNGVFALGNLGIPEINSLAFLAASDVNSASVITITAVGDRDKLKLDDFVFIRGGDYYSTGGNLIYQYGGLNRVAAVNATTGEVTLKYPLMEKFTNVTIARIDSTKVSGTDGRNLFCSENVTLRTGIIKSAGKFLMEGGGALNCRISAVSMDVDSAIYGNNYAYCDFNIGYAAVKRHFLELAVNSYNNTGVISGGKLTTSPVAGKRPIRLSENSTHNRFKLGSLDLSIYTTTGDVPIFIGECRHNYIDIEEIIAPNAPVVLNYFVNSSGLPVELSLFCETGDDCRSV